MIAIAFLGLAAIGAAARMWISDAANRPALPWGTLAVNVAGSFALGLLADASPDLVTMAGVGGLGSFTTFSTFSHEWVAMGRAGELTRAGAYVVVTLAASILAAWVGVGLAT